MQKSIKGEIPMSVIDEVLAHNEAYANNFTKGSLPMPPAKKLAAVVCMDARLISQRLLGTREIMLIHHTDCGMLTFKDDDLKQQILDDIGIKPPFAMESFTDLEADVRQSVARVKSSPYIPHKDEVRGFVYDVESGHLREVT
jgi:carbonic anhydrase